MWQLCQTNATTTFDVSDTRTWIYSSPDREGPCNRLSIIHGSQVPSFLHSDTKNAGAGETNRMANTFPSSNSTQPLGPLKLLQPETSEEKRKRFKHEQHLLLMKWHVKYKCKAYENHHDVSNVCMILYVLHIKRLFPMKIKQGEHQ